jgi:flagellar basal-body rod modification protein FlgD
MSTGTSSVGSNASALKSASSLTTAAGGVLSKAEQDRKTIAQNFDAFLGLLTTQLKNQSPLDPLDANQFTQQLVQFSSVEQQLKTNDLLTAMAKNIGGAGGGAGGFNAANAASLIGTQVSVDGGTQQRSENGIGGYSAAYPVKIQSNYSNYEVSIKNSKGEEVYHSPWAPSGNGDQVFTWNGLRNNGTKVDPTDKYTITVAGELTGTTQKSKMLTDRTGVVTAVDLSGVEPMVQFSGLSMPLSQIKKVSKVGL